MKNNALEIGVGIDIGTSNICSGIYINDSVKIVPNNIGERITPSIILFKTNRKKDQNNKESFKEEILVGEEALCEPIGNIRNYIYKIKRLIGLDYKEIEENGFIESLNYEIVNENGKPKIKIEINGQFKYYSVEELISHIIKKIIQSTENFIDEIMNFKGFKIRSAVFTIPSPFNEKQKQSIIEAAKMAGIDVPRIINESTAAAIAYDIGKDVFFTKSEEKVMIFDLGGGTLKMTILNVNKSEDNNINYNILVTKEDIHLGGSDFDKLLMDYCIQYFCENTNINKDNILKDFRACRRLKIKCENAKKLLTKKNKVIIQIDNFYQENDLFLKIEQDEFIQICKHLYEMIEEKLTDILKEAKLTENDIEKVIMVGGATRINGIKNLLNKIFGENIIKDDINPEEVLAIGATLNAAKLQIQQKINFILQDIIPFNIGIAVQNPDPNDPNEEIMCAIIKKFSKIPCSKEKIFESNLSDENPDIAISVYEGNDEYVINNVKLGGSVISGLEKRGKIKYKIKLNIDVNGKLTGYIQSDELNIIRKINFIVKNKVGYVFGHQIKIARNDNMETILSITSNIRTIQFIIKTSQDINIKINNLTNCCKFYEKLINIYNYFTKAYEILYENNFLYTKELFELYMERIKLKKEDSRQLIQKIKERMINLIKEPNYIEELMNTFNELILGYKNEFYLIFSNYMEIMNNEGLQCIKRGRLIQNYAKSYLEKVLDGIERLVDEKDLFLIDPEIKKFYDTQKNKNREELMKINICNLLVDYLVKGKKYLPENEIFEQIEKRIDKFRQKKEHTLEETNEILALFNDMEDFFEKNEISIGEAFCLANIIKISFEILKITDYNKLKFYIERLEFIMNGKDGKEFENYEWLKDTIIIIEKLKTKI